jgi:hypothetical protein
MSEEKHYVVLQETNGEHNESWLYFIKYEGNEQPLKNLKSVFDEIEWELYEDASVFELDIENFVSEKTAKEMTKLELNYFSYHRKFDGVMKNIDFNFKKSLKNEKKIYKIFKYIGLGQIEDFITEEDTHEGMISLEDQDSDAEISEDVSTSEDSDSDSGTEKKCGKKSFLPSNLKDKKIPKKK